MERDDDQTAGDEYELTDAEAEGDDIAAAVASAVDRSYGQPTTDNETGEPTDTMLPDPEGLLVELAEREKAGGGFPDQMAAFMSQPGMAEAVERARWGTVLVLNRQQGTSLLCMVHRDVPTSWIVQVLPDHANLPPDPNIRYQIAYGSGGAMRVSGLLLPGMWICHGSDVQVIAISNNIGGTQAGFAAFITPAPGAIPNIP